MVVLIYAFGLRLQASDKMKNDSMIVALKAEFVPALKERGFKGSFPHFRRIKHDKNRPTHRSIRQVGWGFVIEIAKCGPEGITTSWGLHIPPNKVRAWDVNDHVLDLVPPVLVRTASVIGTLSHNFGRLEED